MKKFMLALLCLSYFTFAQESEKPAVNAAPATTVKETVAVYIAGKETKESQGMHSVLGGELVRAISMSGLYSAVDRTVQALALLEKEHLYQRGGAVRNEDVMALGKQLAARYLCMAEVQPVRGGAYYLNVRLIDVETAATVASVTETSALEDIGEMRRVAQLLAGTLLGGKNGAAASEPKSVEQAPDQITVSTRRAKADTEAAASPEGASANTGVNTGGTEENTITELAGRSAAAVYTPDCRDREIRYGGRFAYSYLLSGFIIADGVSGGWESGIRGGAFFSLGLTMSVPLTNALSLNHELLFDIRSMDLSFAYDDAAKEDRNVMEYAVSLPLLIRFEVSRFYAEAGLRFDYPLVSDISFARGTDREQVDMGYVAGAGFIFGLSSIKCYLGYRFEGNVTDFDRERYFAESYRHSFGLTLLF